MRSSKKISIILLQKEIIEGKSKEKIKMIKFKSLEVVNALYPSKIEEYKGVNAFIREKIK